uniref:Uncharacterized protein n=1 Tax=Parascaris equorum TaxID=6256 RepID=A0A914R5X7_PAREQ
MADVLWCSLQVVPKVEWLNAAVKSVRIMIAHPAVGYGIVIKLIEFYEKVRLVGLDVYLSILKLFGYGL